jgi:hypothetical protein
MTVDITVTVQAAIASRLAPTFTLCLRWIGYAYSSHRHDEGFMDDPVDNKPPTFWQMLHSVLAAAFGVQSGKNRARDFTHGKPSHFVILGILFTAVFALTLYGIVQLVLHLAGV